MLCEAWPMICHRRTRREPHSEPATGLDSPTSILCLQCPSRVPFSAVRGRAKIGGAWKTTSCAAHIRGLMGLSDHEQALRAAEQRVESLKVSL
jgi:hypothetical protein